MLQNKLAMASWSGAKPIIKIHPAILHGEKVTGMILMGMGTVGALRAALMGEGRGTVQPVHHTTIKPEIKS